MRCAYCMKIVYRWQVKYRRGQSFCPFCGSRICRVCACTEGRACRGGCSWRFDDPSVCSTHPANAVYPKPVA